MRNAEADLREYQMSSISERATGRLQPREMSEADKAAHSGPERIVTDDAVGDALRWLATNASEIGEARRQMELSSKMIKHVESILFLQSEQKTMDAKKAEVCASEKWLKAVNDHAAAAGEFEKMKALREAASARIEAWRSESANYRGMRV